jgi:hypothetical protein
LTEEERIMSAASAVGSPRPVATTVTSSRGFSATGARRGASWKFKPRFEMDPSHIFLGQNPGISMFDVNRSEIGHHGLGIGTGHIKSRHGPARHLASARDRCGQQFDEFRVATRWQAGDSGSGVRPSLDRPGGFIEHRGAFEPSCVVWIAVPVSGRVTVSAACHSFDDVFAPGNEFYLVAVFRSGLWARPLWRCENVLPSQNR